MFNTAHHHHLSSYASYKVQNWIAKSRVKHARYPAKLEFEICFQCIFNIAFFLKDEIRCLSTDAIHATVSSEQVHGSRVIWRLGTNLPCVYTFANVKGNWIIYVSPTVDIKDRYDAILLPWQAIYQLVNISVAKCTLPNVLKHMFPHYTRKWISYAMPIIVQ